jgi:L-glyceraldehyde 3-phosphate reductase
MAQMALAWVLRHATVTSALIGARRVAQIDDGVAALANLEFSDKEIAVIAAALGG